MKTKELLREITQAGGVYLRQRGSHRYFRLPDGQRVMLPVSGAHVEASTAAARKVRRALALLHEGTPEAMTESQKPTVPFTEFPKIARYSREVVVTEKIDGTNAQVYVDDTMTNVYAGSRSRWITPEADNFGFARWVAELLALGPGSHYGEWWGSGIQRRYNLQEKRFSLFNTYRWSDDATRPACCHVVPILWRGPFDELNAAELLAALARNGSAAAPGFMKPEGIVIFHTVGQFLLKKTIEKDDVPKSVAKGAP